MSDKNIVNLTLGRMGLLKYFNLATCTLKKQINILGSAHPGSKAIYNETNQLIEKWSKIIYFLAVYILLPALMLPKFAISLVCYFVTDMGSDALELPFPVL